jgi:hypothetical protein
MKSRVGLRILALAALLVAASGAPLLAGPQLGRSSPTTPPGVPTTGQPNQPAPPDPAQTIYVHHMMDYQLTKRFSIVQQDTGKLVDLSKQLESSTAKASTSNSTADALREAAQIEKLAKSIGQNTRD